MATTDTIADIVELKMAEETLSRIVLELERCAANAQTRNTRAVVDRTKPNAISHPDATALTVTQCEELIEELNDALDSLQLGLGRPYVWLLNR
jgi:hypothetical protein